METTTKHAEGERPDLFGFPEVGVPFFWPLGCAFDLEARRLDQMRRNLRFLREFKRSHIERPAPGWASANEVRLELSTLRLRDFSLDRDRVPTLVVAPYAGHASTVADFYEGQSLVRALQGAGVREVYVTDWKSATPGMAMLDIDAYLGDLALCVDEIGGVANLVGLCQGGWLSAMYAARFPDKAVSLVLAGAPIDTAAVDCEVRRYATTFPMSFFERLVRAGGGVLQGRLMLMGFKSLHPEQHYFKKFVELYENIDNEDFTARFRRFEEWYQHTIDLPGAFYLQAIRELFRENRLVRGEFTGLGRRLSMRDVTCGLYLLAGDRDDITPAEQVMSTVKYAGTHPDRIVRDMAPGGHIGLFMGKRAIDTNWPRIGRWIAEQSHRAELKLPRWAERPEPPAYPRGFRCTI